MKRFFLVFIFFLFIPGEILADTVYLKNGRSIEGLIKSEDVDSVQIDIGFGTVGFNMKEVKSIVRSSAGDSYILKERWLRQKEDKDKQIKEEKIRREEEKIREEKKPKGVEVVVESGHVFVKAILNKKVPVRLAMDTGASFVVITQDTADKLGLKKSSKDQVLNMQLADGRKIEARCFKLGSISLSGVEEKDVDAAILPLEVKDLSFGDGLLGMSFLGRFNFKVDIKNNRLILEK